MNYELAKQLKDAGFPQVHPASYPNGTLMRHPRDINNTEEVYFSTLHQLIEACGDRFSMLNRSIDNKFHAWATRNEEVKYLDDIYSEGDTPEEAVANLWLKLNENT